MDYELRKYEPWMMSQIVALRVREWGEDPDVSAAYISWMYEQNPYTEQTRIYVALDKGEVIATRGMSSGMLSCDGAQYPIVAATDTVVAPEHRGHRLFNALTRFGLDDLRSQGYDYSLNLAGSRTTHLLSLRSGWVRVCPFQPLYWGAVPGAGSDASQQSSRLTSALRGSRLYPMMRRAKARLLRFRRKADAFRRSPFQKLDAWAATAANRVATLESAPRPAQMASLVRRIEEQDPRIRFHMDEQYYAWRFKDPRSSFRFLFAEGTGSELAGFAVLLLLRGGEVAIVDWQYSDEALWLEMIREALSSGGLPVVSIWSATLPGSLRDGLTGLGFHPGPQSDTRSHPAKGVLLTSTNPGIASADWRLNDRAMADAEQWDLRMLFSDAY